MLRILSLVLLLLGSALHAQTAQRPLAQAMAQVRAQNWDMADTLATGDGTSARAVVMWHRLREGAGTPAQVVEFLEKYADWPGLPYLRAQSEGVMALADAPTVVAFFADQKPQTGKGVLAYARALEATGDSAAARAEVGRAWRTMGLEPEDRAALAAAYGPALAEHMQARLDLALWRGSADEARELMKQVDTGWQRLALARLDLRATEPGVDGRINAVPDTLQGDPGLAYERFLWRIRKDRTDDALALMIEVSTSAEALGRPEFWADHRIRFARELMRAGDGLRAYQVAANHHMTEGADYAELEWLAGFAALRLLKQPETAQGHFERFLAAVNTPISLARGGYWLGRAYEEMGDEEAARRSYIFGARHQTAFYGLLSADRGGLAFDDSLRGSEVFPPWREASFTRSSVFEAAVLLLAADEVALSERFFTHLAETLDRSQIGQLGEMLAELKRPHIQVMLGKRAAEMGHQIAAPYYALHPLAERDLPVPAELALAITRRESEFDPDVISPAGARGLMQVMPATAEEVSTRLGLRYSQPALTADPDYNVRLGTAYLAELIERFGGNPVLVAAAYNAGPSRPETWVAENGDPRSGTVDVVDWIEMIPFTETRNYVMRVTESLPVYRARLGRDPHPVPFVQELRGSTLLPGTP